MSIRCAYHVAQQQVGASDQIMESSTSRYTIHRTITMTITCPCLLTCLDTCV